MEIRKTRAIRIPGAAKPNQPSSLPLVTPWGLIVAHDGGDIVCFDLMSLEVRWAVPAHNMHPWLVLTASLLCFGNGSFTHLDPESGAVLRSLPFDAHDFVIGSEAITFVSKNERGFVFYDLDTFEETRRLELPHDPRIDFPGDPRTLVARDRSLILFGRATVISEFRDPVVAYDLLTGAEVWVADLKARLLTACSPSDQAGSFWRFGVHGGHLFIAKGRTLCSFDLASGDLEWSTPLPLVGPEVYFGPEFMRLWASSTRDGGRYADVDYGGRLLRDLRLEVPRHLLSRPMRPFEWGEYVCLTTDTGFLALLDRSTGRVITSFEKAYNMGAFYVPCGAYLLYCLWGRSVIHVLKTTDGRITMK